MIVLNTVQFNLGFTIIKKFLEKTKRDLMTAKKILDKGGLVVVTEGGNLITTYDFESNNRLGKY